MNDQLFHRSVAKVFFVSQFFALLPVSNLMATNVLSMRYAWLSVPTLYTAVIMLLNGLELSTVFNDVLWNGLDFHISGTLCFVVVCLLEQAFFWRLATKWPVIMQKWVRSERVFLRPPYNQYATFNVRNRSYTLSGILVLGAFVEHVLLTYNSFDKSQKALTQCNLNVSVWDVWYRRERHHLHLVLPFRLWMLPLIEWTNLTLAFSRSYTDAFIICLSIGLAARFRQLHMRIAAVHKKCLPTLFWTETRQHYLELKRLVRLVNDAISPLILLACSNNMYFICLQLFNSFKNLGSDKLLIVAFWFSLLFAIVRTMLTFFFASLVDECSRHILTTLRDVPSSSWCREIQRFSEQLAVDTTALSGGGLFFLTRKLILALASTIVTYELMVTDLINKGNIRQQNNPTNKDYCSVI